MGSDSIGTHEAWDVSDIILEDELRHLEGMAGSLLVGHLKEQVKSLPKEFSAIEIGSGLGKSGLFTAMLGAHVTLLDSSSEVLQSARRLYGACGLPLETWAENALSLPEALRDNFDLSLSLGVNEHFSGEARQAIFDAHYAVLRPDGMTFIAVPNRHCFSYRLAMWMWRLTGRWPSDLYEYGYSIGELHERMQQAGFTNVEIISGTFPKQDFRFLFLGNLRAALRKLGIGRSRSTSEEPQKSYVTPAMIREKLDMAPLPCRFLHRQSRTLIAIGIRR